MTVAVPSQLSQNQSLLRPIMVGAAVAGTLDQISAFITFGWSVPRGDRCRIGRPSGSHEWRRFFLDPWIGAPLHDCFHCGSHLLSREPAAPFPARSLAGLRHVLRHCCLPRHESGGPAVERASCRWTVSAARSHPGSRCAHADHRAADLVQPAQILALMPPIRIGPDRQRRPAHSSPMTSPFLLPSPAAAASTSIFFGFSTPSSTRNTPSASARSSSSPG